MSLSAGGVTLFPVNLAQNGVEKDPVCALLTREP